PTADVLATGKLFMAQEVKIPDIGDFDKVEVIEVLVAKGDSVDVEQPLITLESDKATLEVPTTVAGEVAELRVAEGAQVGEGDVIALVEATAQEATAQAPAADEPQQPAAQPATPAASAQGDYDCDVLVLGAGPGGYTAAFRAADLGL